MMEPITLNFILQNKDFVSLFLLSFALSFHTRWTKAVYSWDEVFRLHRGQVNADRAELSCNKDLKGNCAWAPFPWSLVFLSSGWLGDS